MRKIAMLGLLLVPVLSASAQSKGTELALKIGSVGFTSYGGTNSSTLTSLNVGNGGSVGLGFFVSPGMALEPSASLSYMHSDGSSLTVLGIGLALPIYFDKTWGHSGMYFAPGVGMVSVSGGGSSSSQFSVSGELGTKMKVSDPVSLRLGVDATYGLKNNDTNSAFSLTALFGVSVFFKK